jgi:hypothetical protein
MFHQGKKVDQDERVKSWNLLHVQNRNTMTNLQVVDIEEVAPLSEPESEPIVFKNMKWFAPDPNSPQVIGRLLPPLRTHQFKSLADAFVSITWFNRAMSDTELQSLSSP